jgi:hypothetical protein
MTTGCSAALFRAAARRIVRVRGNGAGRRERSRLSGVTAPTTAALFVHAQTGCCTCRGTARSVGCTRGTNNRNQHFVAVTTYVLVARHDPQSGGAGKPARSGLARRARVALRPWLTSRTRIASRSGITLRTSGAGRAGGASFTLRPRITLGALRSLLTAAGKQHAQQRDDQGCCPHHPKPSLLRMRLAAQSLDGPLWNCVASRTSLNTSAHCRRQLTVLGRCVGPSGVAAGIITEFQLAPTGPTARTMSATFSERRSPSKVSWLRLLNAMCTRISCRTTKSTPMIERRMSPQVRRRRLRTSSFSRPPLLD